MRSEDPLFPMAIEQVGLAVLSLIGWTGVHIAEHIPSKWKLRKASMRLRALETLVQRLIVLMALKLDLKPVRPRSTPSKSDDAPANKTFEITDGVEIVDFPKAYQRGLTLLPPLVDFGEGTDLSDLPRNTTPTYIKVRRFTRRIVALQKVLDAPEAHAKRLARSLSRCRKSGELKPIIVPSKLPSGLPPEIGLLHGGLTFQLGEALKNLDTS
ncbi:MAG: hypothetical protein AAFV54_04395 [Pseudomonadota bacterium]